METMDTRDVTVYLLDPFRAARRSVGITIMDTTADDRAAMRRDYRYARRHGVFKGDARGMVVGNRVIRGARTERTFFGR